MWRRFWHWFVHGQNSAPRAFHCPICSREVVGGEGYTMGGGTAAGPIHFEPSREELVGRCPVHGHPPLNERR